MAEGEKKVVEKSVYVVLKGDVPRDGVISAVTNPTDALKAMDKYQSDNPGAVASFVKVVLPKGAPRAQKAA